MNARISLLCLAAVCLTSHLPGQEIPLVYDVEHTGSHFPKPVLPALDELPILVSPLWADMDIAGSPTANGRKWKLSWTNSFSVTRTRTLR